MRRLAYISYVMLIASPVMAHEDHYMSHHWSSPIYLNEIRLQMTVIGIGMLVYGIIGIIRTALHAK